jgi:hydrogenase small subunit
MPQDYSAEDILVKAKKGEFDPFVLVIEGTFFDEMCALDLPGSCKSILGQRSPSALKSKDFTPWCSAGYLMNEGRFISCNEFVARLMAKAAVVIATGACATYGGVPAEYNGLGQKSPAGEFGTLEDPNRNLPGLIDYAYRFMGIDLYAATGSQRIDKYPGPSYSWRSRGYPQGGVKGQKVIAVAGCPPAGDWIMKNLAHAILYIRGIMPEPELDMDQWNRAKYIYGITTHQNCPRGNFYAVGAFAKKFGDPECTFTLGCKGIASNSPAPLWGWVGGQGGCTRGGVCIACTAPGFPDLYEPFYSPPKPTGPGVSGHVH